MAMKNSKAKARANKKESSVPGERGNVPSRPQLKVVGQVAIDRFLAVKEKARDEPHSFELVAVSPRNRALK